MNRFVFVVLLTSLVGVGCGQRPTVVVYCALDREFSEPILKRFEAETGYHVLAKYDTESTKSVGLTEQLLRERSRPRCDVFWNNEILNTVRLANDGVLEPFESTVGREYPERFRSPENLWYGFAARARVLLLNTGETEGETLPTKREELTDPRWRGRLGMAKPLFGTTATEVACLFAVAGPEWTKQWLLGLRSNGVHVLSGNKQVAVDVGAGQLALGMTDTDDSLGELRANHPVKITYLGNGSDGLGILLIPNTVSLIRGAPNAEPARRLIDYLLSPETEEILALGPSGQIPLHPRAKASPKLDLPEHPKWMAVNYEKAVEHWSDAMTFIKDTFTAP
ncbi:Iron uptake protein A1 precursor [Planctomycetes bacterium Pan216]|uniref:Iron uptake protein A1 n=1 Tax=Kolteria novifilia TaxID=2527975 RepID=A0A518BCH4_9BACT|nr:Iron uptake protein A1 precursor [Planctomycetes bacterium Pan216]